MSGIASGDLFGLNDGVVFLIFAPCHIGTARVFALFKAVEEVEHVIALLCGVVLSKRFVLCAIALGCRFEVCRTVGRFGDFAFKAGKNGIAQIAVMELFLFKVEVPVRGVIERGVILRLLCGEYGPHV